MSECKFIALGDHRECVTHSCKETVCLGATIAALTKERDEALGENELLRELNTKTTDKLEVVYICLDKAEAACAEMRHLFGCARQSFGSAADWSLFDEALSSSCGSLALAVIEAADYLARKARTPAEKGAGLMALVEKLAAFEKGGRA